MPRQTVDLAAAPAQRHGFVLLPRCPGLALAAALDVLAAANDALDHPAHAAVMLSAEGGLVRSANAPLWVSTQSLESNAPFDLVWVVGDTALPDDGDAVAQVRLRTWLRTQAGAGALLGGIGTGAAVLAQAGLLAGHRATLPWTLVPPMAQAHPQVVWSSNLFEIDRQRLSCAGGTAVLDLMITWLGRRHGDRLAQALLGHFGLERLREAGERQAAPVAARIGTGSAKLAEAVSLMEANLGEPLPTEDIARLVGVSRRQLERLFKQHLDELPSRYYAELRLARARRLLQQTPQSILQIGLACGFATGSHFSNAYRARYGHTPRDERSQRAAAWRDNLPNPTAPSAPQESPS